MLVRVQVPADDGRWIQKPAWLTGTFVERQGYLVAMLGDAGTPLVWKWFALKDIMPADREVQARLIAARARGAVL